MDMRTKGIILGQSGNQALQLVIHKNLDPDNEETFKEKYNEYTIMMYNLNVKLAKLSERS